MRVHSVYGGLDKSINVSEGPKG